MNLIEHSEVKSMAIIPTVVCDICKKPTALLAKDMRKEPALFGSDKITLTLFKCSDCGFEYVVQLDNEETISLMAQYSGLALKAFSMKHPSRHYKGQLTKISKKVDDIRKDLAKKYDGEHYRSVQLDMKVLRVHTVAQIF